MQAPPCGKSRTALLAVLYSIIVDRLKASVLYLRGYGIGKRVQRGELILREGGAESNIVADEGAALQCGEYVAHLLAAGGRPASVFHEGNFFVLEVFVT